MTGASALGKIQLSLTKLRQIEKKINFDGRVSLFFNMSGLKCICYPTGDIGQIFGYARLELKLKAQDGNKNWGAVNKQMLFQVKEMDEYKECRKKNKTKHKIKKTEQVQGVGSEEFQWLFVGQLKHDQQKRLQQSNQRVRKRST